ncbi:hypothetical protein IGI04_034537 [Brassica rapa subsp. trilocularis]|uniref:Transcription factor MYC/MYB N-terminal domain-containing protein n=1 Tax=Brassica rapa subsp. trilocularis TaxID=1813537 RepID=A0ABQ7LA00_BRACM|nr:hypothetical protein IGI04_034537 [Brassica rapa subsp. trilocularis]
MEEHLNPLAVTHLLQHTLRSLCIHENSQWVYAVFWRILPRNYPPPKWDGQGAYDRSRGNRRNWILVWEDGFCNFSASAGEVSSGECSGSGSTAYGHSDYQQYQGLQPELFFKMSHEIYNYGEGVHVNVQYPRTWEAQFQSGIKVSYCYINIYIYTLFHIYALSYIFMHQTAALRTYILTIYIYIFT